MTAIRQLGPADIADMRALNALFGAAFDDPDLYRADTPGEDWLRRVLGRAHVIVLVAESGGRITGGLVAYELEKLEQARSEVYLYDLAVDADHRRQGIATALIRRLGAIAGQRGAWVVFVQADPPDAAAVALYDKLGVREEVLHFDIAPRPE